MQFIKNQTNELVLLGKPIDKEDLINKILNGPGKEYKVTFDVVNVYEMLISFDKIHKTLINKEASLQQSYTPSSFFSISINPINRRNNQSR